MPTLSNAVESDAAAEMLQKRGPKVLAFRYLTAGLLELVNCWSGWLWRMGQVQIGG